MKSASRPVVLIVEDEAIIRLNAVDAFLDEGFEVVEAEDAAAAILVARGCRRLDVLFTDVNMPGAMNGVGLAEHLIGLRPPLRIIVTSALPLPRNVDHIGVRFLAKPYSLRGACQLATQMLA